MTTPWTDARCERLRELYAQGLSAAQIAADLGGVTRNAVIGKAHRLGLTGRIRTPQQRCEDSQRAARTRAHTREPVLRIKPCIPFVEPDTTAPDMAPTRFNARKTLFDLEPDECLWPFGDPQKPDFLFCGQLQYGALPYCLEHCRIAYRPSEPRRRDSFRAFPRAA